MVRCGKSVAMPDEQKPLDARTAEELNALEAFVVDNDERVRVVSLLCMVNPVPDGFMLCSRLAQYCS